jgi:pSer/pThr/pTyr-binding forkhead associated (FHA) protein
MPAAELVILSGRQSGTRRPLGVPVTFIGRDAGCDLRLNVEGVEPFHCVLASGPDGVALRDLGGGRGTYVNGQRVAAAALRDGDLLDVGPFRFRLLLPAVAPEPAGPRDALRVQVAAVAAQQAALDEEAARLQQRRLALEQQEAQLAAHLEGQRREVVEAAERQRAERSAWEEQKATTERQAEELARDRDAVRAERQNLAERTAALEQVKERLQEQEAQLAVRQVRLNTQRELDARQLQEGWDCLEQDQQRWRRRRAREGQALRARQLLLIEGERKLAEARRLLVRERQTWESQRRALEGELHGLNNRVAHQRQKFQEQEKAAPAATTRAAEPSEAAEPKPAPTAELERLEGVLADQRAQLVEQWERLARVQASWQRQRDEAAAALEALARRLAQQEENLARRGDEAGAAEVRLGRRQELLDRLRQEVSAGRARLHSDQQAWEAEREQVRAEARRLAELARRQLAGLGELRRKWGRRRQQEVDALQSERQAAEQLRQEVARWRLDLVQQTRHLDEQARAMETEVVALGLPDDGRVDRAERACARWLAQHGDLLRTIERQRQGIRQEMQGLEARRGELCEQIERLARARAELQEQQAALDEREARLAANRARLEQEQKQAEARRVMAEQRLTVVQEEAEHLARALLPESGPPSEALDRAA